MASASRFVPLVLPLNEFIEEQSNKNTLSKTNRDVSLLKEFLRAKEVYKEIENLEAKELDEVLCAFIVEVKKKEGGEYEEVSLSTGNQQSPQQALSLFRGAKIQGGTFNISINSVSQQSSNLSLHSAKPLHD